MIIVLVMVMVAMIRASDDEEMIQSRWTMFDNASHDGVSNAHDDEHDEDQLSLSDPCASQFPNMNFFCNNEITSGFSAHMSAPPDFAPF